MINIIKNLKNAVSIGKVGLVGFINHNYPMEYGNCFSMHTEDGKEYKIVNFFEENLTELLNRGVLSYPIIISAISDNHAVICDKRIPNNWFNSSFCRICTPVNLLPLPQQIMIFLSNERGE